jgi:hypothetical protein
VQDEDGTAVPSSSCNKILEIGASVGSIEKKLVLHIQSILRPKDAMRAREAGMCKCNIETRLPNHGCHINSRNFIYADCVSVALVTQ